jgi:copper resistance protein C
LPTTTLRLLLCRTIILALPGLILGPERAMAHAVLVQSQPAAGTSVPIGKLAVSLSYNSRIDRVRSRLSLTTPDHKEAVLQISPVGPPNVINSVTQLGSTGAYILRWQVLAVDGHITRGDIPFTVTDR